MEDLLTRLCRFIVDYYDQEELRTLAFDLSVYYDALPGWNTADKARALVLYLGRQQRSLRSLHRPGLPL